MIFLETIINKIIELDDMAKSKIKGIKEKEENIETYINEKLQIEKEKIDNKFLYKKKNMQEKYEVMFEQQKAKLDEDKQRRINNLQNKYEQEKQNILKKLLNGII